MISVKKTYTRTLSSLSNEDLENFKIKLEKEKTNCKYFIVAIDIFNKENLEPYLNYVLNNIKTYDLLHNKKLAEAFNSTFSSKEYIHYHKEVEKFYDLQVNPYIEITEDKNSRNENVIISEKRSNKSLKQLFQNLLEYSLLSFIKAPEDSNIRKNITFTEAKCLKPLKKMEQLNASLSLCLFLDKHNILKENRFYLILEVNFDGPLNKYKKNENSTALIELLKYIVFFWNNCLEYCFKKDAEYLIFNTNTFLHKFINNYKFLFFLEHRFNKVLLPKNACNYIHFSIKTEKNNVELLTLQELLNFNEIGNQFLVEKMRYYNIKEKIRAKKIAESNKAFDKLLKKTKLAEKKVAIEHKEEK